jgi:transcriptional regulator with XRE-family HTH domain
LGGERSNDIDEFVAGKIRAYRKQLGLSQVDLAEKLGLSFQQIQKYEKGANRISAGRLFELAKHFGIPVAALYPPTGEPREEAPGEAKDLKAISDFMLSADGWRLFRAFLRLKDQRTRSKIIALVEEITES